MAMQKTIWISFDLGVKGDYEQLYAWLDNHEAKECGPNLATLRYAFQEDLLTELTQDILGTVTVEKRDRLYVIWREDASGKLKGRFILGKRKAAPWVGFGAQESPLDEEE
jgi:hypothetical protein